MENFNVLLSGFSDEGSESKRAEEQIAVVAAIGMRRYTLRFIDLAEIAGEGGVKNVLHLSRQELAAVRRLNDRYGLSVASIGSPIGKVKLLDREDGTTNRYVPLDEHIGRDLAAACDAAEALGTRLVRGFSFYPPAGDDAEAHLEQAADGLGQIAEACQTRGVVFGLEVEANLVGQSGRLLAELHRKVAHPALVLVFDAANLLSQGYTPDQTFDEYLAMKPGLGWIHAKDYLPPKGDRGAGGRVDEEALRDYRPVDRGSGVYQRVFVDLAGAWPDLAPRVRRLGLEGLLVDLEPHLRGGGQFGGFSGPDGMGIALSGLCRALDGLGIPHDLRDADDL